MNKNWIAFAIVCCVMIMTIHSPKAESHIEATNNEFELDGKQVIESNRKIVFNDTIYITSLERKFHDESTLISNKWGDYYFGLSMGQRPKSNTGWCVFHFCVINGLVNGKQTRINGTYPMRCYMTVNQDMSMAVFNWNITDEANSTAPPRTIYSLRLASLSGYKDWLFGKVSVSGDDQLHDVLLQCRPGGTGKYHRAPQTESWFAYSSEDRKVNQKIDVQLKSPGIIAYNRFAREDQGCFVVVDPEQVEELSIRGGASSTLRFLVKNKKSFIFAIGFFDGVHYEQANRMFLLEKQDNIQNQLENMDWTPKADPQAFEKLLNSIRELPLDSREKTDVEKLVAEWKKADMDCDIAERQAVETRLRKLKEAVINRYLSTFR